MTFILHTSRLTLRHFNSEKDAETMYRLNLNPNVMRYTGDVAFESIESSKIFIQNYTAYSLHGYGRFAVDITATGETIGWCGLKFHPEEAFIDLGYRFFEHHWNKGYATEASIASITYGFDDLNLSEIIARVNSSNLASIRVIEKLGFTESFDFPKDHQCDRIFRLDKHTFLSSTIQKNAKSI